jgi:hypothetical protein
LVTKSTAPSSSARNVTSEPRSVAVEIITTGVGLRPHQLVEELQPVHLRHLDVERDHVGIQLLDHVARLEGVGRRAHDLDVGLLVEDVA